MICKIFRYYNFSILYLKTEASSKTVAIYKFLHKRDSYLPVFLNWILFIQMHDVFKNNYATFIRTSLQGINDSNLC